MSRVLVLRPSFFRSRVSHAPVGSTADIAIRLVIRQLAGAPVLPGPKDTPDLRMLEEQLYARPIPGTDLALLYGFDAREVRIRAIRPAAW